MDNIKVGRNKKGDKAKEKYERNGGFSQKHVRIAELLAARRLAAGNSTIAKPGSK
jgi:hypothetical protein